MCKWVAIALALLFPCLAQAQQAAASDEFLDNTACSKDQVAPAIPPAGKKVKKPKLPADKVVPLSLVVCEVEKALDAYQQSPEVANKTGKELLPGILSADFDFKTVVDTKGTFGIGFYIFKIGGSYDKQSTNDVVFQYVPKSLLKGPGYAVEKATVSLQDQLLKTIKDAALAIKAEQAKPVPISEKDPLIFKQLSITISYGVTWDINGGATVPINVVTVTAQLDRSKNAVQSVKLVFAPPPKPGEKPQSD